MIITVCTVIAALAALWSAREAMRNNELEAAEKSRIEITTRPANGQECHQVRNDLALGGTADMVEGAELWAITKTSDGFYVAAVARPRSPGDGDWTVKLHGFGSPQDIGKNFTILLVEAPPNAAHKFQKASVPPSNPLPKLPDGTRTLKTVCVKKIA
ncbi:hypothetical protein BJF79_14285 [Actinomadura sp. CNU-125]|uniref:hypothetical protein n=1 Tax=Actinomadura sp. CNU-125 TaxID=1904961 RepID=UPI0009680399|nr:hypothetical protein [Actinomadura sp. CNU-125]OLT23911.1 hypothetical protein BJF79_14285 [Actinomadura sp. CNU-125]